MDKPQKLALALYILLIFSSLIAPINAQVIAEVSNDNITWYNMSEINQVDKYACQPYLNQSTQYYFRAKNATTSFGYRSARTTGDNQMEIAIISGLFILTILFALAFWYFDNGLKPFFLLLCALSIVFNINVLANLAGNNGVSAAVVSLLWVLYRVLLIVFGFIFLWVLYTAFKALKASKKTAIETDNDALMRRLPK